VSVLLFLCFYSPGFSPSSPSSPSLSLAIGKKISDQKKVFSFFVLSFFSYRANLKNQRDIATEKENKHKPGKLPLSYLPGVCAYLFFTGRGLNHEG